MLALTNVWIVACGLLPVASLRMDNNRSPTFSMKDTMGRPPIHAETMDRDTQTEINTGDTTTFNNCNNKSGKGSGDPVYVFDLNDETDPDDGEVIKFSELNGLRGKIIEKLVERSDLQYMRDVFQKPTGDFWLIEFDQENAPEWLKESEFKLCVIHEANIFVGHGEDAKQWTPAETMNRDTQTEINTGDTTIFNDNKSSKRFLFPKHGKDISALHVVWNEKRCLVFQQEQMASNKNDKF